MLWSIAFIEGFSTLAVEVIAIRLAIPVVGSSITLTGVMLGVVLFALSAGYWRGGMLSARWDSTRTSAALARNLFIAAVLYGALGFPLEAALLEKSLNWGLSLPVAIGLTASLLFLLPIYLASQTVPMLAELTNNEGKAGKASGKVLFYSTIGSVAGGIITPVWLFPSIGVARSAWVVCGLLAAAAGVMAIRHFRSASILATGAAALIVVVSAQVIASPKPGLFSFDSPYQTIRITEEKAEDGRMRRVMSMGGGRASGIYSDDGTTAFAYIREAEKAMAATHPVTVLVIGAAGFTFPRDAAKLPTVRRVDAVDVDPAVKDIAETKFLRQRLPSNVRFLPFSARYAVRKLKQDGNHYEFAFVDAYYGQGIPEELVTVEFFQDIRAVSEKTGINVIMDSDINSDFARNLLASFGEAFGEVWIRDVSHGEDLTNILVTSWPAEGSVVWKGTGRVYRDDKSSADKDHVKLIWGQDES